MNRRELLKLFGAASLGLPAGGPFALAGESSVATINRIELFPVHYPMQGYFKFFDGARGSLGRAAVVVKMTASDGTVGWGQSVPLAKWSYETLETAFVALRDYYTPALVGKPIDDIPGALQAMDQVIAPSFTTGMPITRAGVDLAMHDILGKQSHKSLAELWGKQPAERLTLSWTVNVRSLDDIDSVMEQGESLGYKNFNIKVSPDPTFDVELARRVRARAPEGFLWADANGGYDIDTALAAAPKLADAGVDILEAPLRPNRISGYQALKKQGALPILMDEGVVTPVELEEFIQLGMIDGLALKPSRCGGLWSARHQIELCEKHGLLWVGSGLTDPDISFAASLALYGAYGLKRPAALNGPQFLAADILKTPIEIENGEAVIPSGPGLGIDVNEARLQELVSTSGVDDLLRR